MNCGNCGAAAQQGPDGKWLCTNYCGWSAVTPGSTAVACSHDAMGTGAASTG